MICAAVVACADAACGQAAMQVAPTDSEARCFGEPEDLGMSGCAALIASGRETPLSLASAFNDRGTARLTRRDYAHAIQEFDQAIRLDNDYIEPFLGRCAARAYAGKGLETALADCDAALRLDSGNIDALGLPGLVHFEIGHYDKAIADCDR